MMRTLGAFSALSTLTFAIGDQRDEGTQSSRSDSVRKRDELPEMLQNIANTAASEDSTCCSEERTGVERYRKDGSERMVCPAHWPSESGRFEPPTERGWLRASDPVWWFLGYKDEYFQDSFDSDKPRQPPTDDPNSWLAPNVRPVGLVTLHEQDKAFFNDTECCRPTWDCFILAQWSIDSDSRYAGRGYNDEEQERLTLQKRECCQLQYEMSCLRPVQFRRFDFKYEWAEPPYCTSRDTWFDHQLSGDGKGFEEPP